MPQVCTMPCPAGTTGAIRPWAKPTGEDSTWGPCCPPGMDKVAPPTRSEHYSITTDATEYKPCELLEVTINVLDRYGNARP